MKLSTLSQSPVVQARSAANSQPAASTETTVSPDTVQVSPKSSRSARIGKAVLAAAVPAAIGVYAGLGRGPLAGIAGAAAATPLLALTGTLAGAYVGETVMGKSDGEQLGAVVLGAGAGLIGGGVGSYLLCSGGSSTALAVGLGLIGGLSGVAVSIFRDSK
jgi:hypothetical protein